MKYLFGFIAFIVIVVIVSTVNDMALRFFNVYFSAANVILTAGVIFLLLVIINMSNEIQQIKQTILELRSDVDSLQKRSAATKD